MTTLALDTSVAVPLLVEGHEAHEQVVRWWADRAVCLTGHSLAETYAVLTRLPGDARLATTDAARLIAHRFSSTLVLDADSASDLPRVLSAAGVAGGATYDALVALAARQHHAVLATRDARALPTYRAIGADVVVVT